MARPLRLEFAGAIYHLAGRGNARQKVFFSDADHQLFLNIIQVGQPLRLDLPRQCGGGFV